MAGASPGEIRCSELSILDPCSKSREAFVFCFPLSPLTACVRNKFPHSRRSHKTTNLQRGRGGEGSKGLVWGRFPCSINQGLKRSWLPWPWRSRLGHGQALQPRRPGKNEPEQGIQEKDTERSKVHHCGGQETVANNSDSCFYSDFSNPSLYHGNNRILQCTNPEFCPID